MDVMRDRLEQDQHPDNKAFREAGRKTDGKAEDRALLTKWYLALQTSCRSVVMDRVNRFRWKQMAEIKEKTREEVIADYVSGNGKLQGQTVRSVGFRPGCYGNHQLPMDAMTIILVFLLMNYSIDPLKIDGGEDMQPPASTTITNPTPTPTITVSGS